MEPNDYDNYTEIPLVTTDEICAEIKKLMSKKSSGLDLITSEILKQLPQNIISKITAKMNATFNLQYISIYWKTAEVIMLNKPGKPAMIFPATRFNNIIEEMEPIPVHQFGFRKNHSTIDQVHRITRDIENAFEEKKFARPSSSTSSKLLIIPKSYYNILTSYISDRFFRIKHVDTYVLRFKGN